MPLDPQIEAILSEFSSLPEPTDVVSYREAANCLVPPFPAPELPEVRDMHVAGAAGLLDARLYRPKAEDGLPLLVYFHGGGFVIGSLEASGGAPGLALAPPIVDGQWLSFQFAGEGGSGHGSAGGCRLHGLQRSLSGQREAAWPPRQTASIHLRIGHHGLGGSGPCDQAHP